MKRNRLWYFAILGCILISVGFFLSLSIGAKDISMHEILQSFLHYDGSFHHQLIRDVRLTRTLASMLVGGMLALAGCAMQGTLRNPLAEPSIMGVTQGAVLAIAIASAASFAIGTLGYFAVALFGALISMLFVLLLTLHQKMKQSIATILLMGTSLSMFFLSLASMIALLSNRSQDLAFWIAGGFRQVTWTQVGILFVIAVLIFLYYLFLAPSFDVLAMGDEAASGLGIAVQRIKRNVFFTVMVLCAFCVAVSGNIGFVGLCIPHMLRKLFGNNYRVLFPFAFLYGAILLLYADLAARTLLAPYELPIGLFTALFGVPVFLILIRKEHGAYVK